MIFSCPECQYSQENEPFELCPNCVKKGLAELSELKADLVAAHVHIDHLHSLAFGSCAPLPFGMMAAITNWEDEQCPF